LLTDLCPFGIFHFDGKNTPSVAQWKAFGKWQIHWLIRILRKPEKCRACQASDHPKIFAIAFIATN
jgi:hypothetical protein